MLFVTEPNRIKVLAGENPRTHDVRRRRDRRHPGHQHRCRHPAGDRNRCRDRRLVHDADGLAALGIIHLNFTAAALLPALIGAMIAVLSRSTTIAVTVGLLCSSSAKHSSVRSGAD
jgi:hypothetical protein